MIKVIFIYFISLIALLTFFNIECIYSFFDFESSGKAAKFILENYVNLIPYLVSFYVFIKGTDKLSNALNLNAELKHMDSKEKFIRKSMELKFIFKKIVSNPNNLTNSNISIPTDDQDKIKDILIELSTLKVILKPSKHFPIKNELFAQLHRKIKDNLFEAHISLSEAKEIQTMIENLTNSF